MGTKYEGSYAKYEKLRNKKGLTDYKVAELTGISRSSISDWKNGDYAPNVDKLIKIAQLFEVSVEQLVRKVKVNKKGE